MITVSERALTVLQQATGHPSLGPDSGMRIACADDQHGPMQVAAVSGPEPGDSVVEHEGARVFLGPGADAEMSGRRLDVELSEDGRRAKFWLRAS